jgi:hypothetical protein
MTKMENCDESKRWVATNIHMDNFMPIDGQNPSITLPYFKIIYELGFN